MEADMWAYEYATETDVPTERIWAVLSDIDSWAAWDTSMQEISLQGPFEVGSKVSMMPEGQDPITSTIVEIEHTRRYADETEFGGCVLGFSHTLTPLDDGRTRIVHRLEITGPAADAEGPKLGSAITEDFPEAMSGLVRQAATR
jgi:uncharacterized protein YndB with AHSA1/START domain